LLPAKPFTAQGWTLPLATSTRVRGGDGVNLFGDALMGDATGLVNPDRAGIVPGPRRSLFAAPATKKAAARRPGLSIARFP
jgi:hypothetical protein